MKLDVTQLDTTTVLIGFSTETLDAANVKLFREAMQPVTTAWSNVIIDMSRLNFVDSSGLGALLSCLRAMNTKEGQLALFGMTKPVKSLFEMVRMHRIFTIYNSREEAQAAL